ncbi:MAG TPA: AsnC family transcriptional regulator [Gallionellaceae bacterium]|nr:AsnC family transcriptional regulator [Gallionellaceae bacterium]
MGESMDELDRAIVNSLQGDFPICDHPFAEVAGRLGIAEQELISRIEALLQNGVLSRFGPMYHAERMGGRLSLVAMKIPDSNFEHVAEIINAMPEVAHNYARDHVLNMWFVLATETADEHAAALKKIERDTGYPVYDMPKIKEYFVGLRLTV